MGANRSGRRVNLPAGSARPIDNTIQSPAPFLGQPRTLHSGRDGGQGRLPRGVAHALKSAGLPFTVLNFEHSSPSLPRDESWRQ
jgi:hypothetical protein